MPKAVIDVGYINSVIEFFSIPIANFTREVRIMSVYEHYG